MLPLIDEATQTPFTLRFFPVRDEWLRTDFIDGAFGFQNNSPGALLESESQNRSVYYKADPDPTQTFRWICDLCLSMPIAILGLIGNSLAFAVLCNHRQSLTTNIVLRALAIADSLILASVLTLRSSIYLHVDNLTRVYITRWLSPTMYWLRVINTWLTVLLTADRYIAVCRPLHAQRLCTMRRTYLRISFIVVAGLAFSLPRFFESDIGLITSSTYGFYYTDLYKSRTYTIVYRMFMFLVVLYVIPMVAMVLLNASILICLRQSSITRSETFKQPFSQGGNLFSGRQRNSNSAGSAGSGGSGNSRSGCFGNNRDMRCNRSITVVVVVIVIVCVLCNVSAMITHLLWPLEELFKTFTRLAHYRRLASNFSNVLVTLNSAVNFAIYSLCSRNFRAVLRRWVACREEVRRRSCRHNNRHRNKPNVSFIANQEIDKEPGLAVNISPPSPLLENKNDILSVGQPEVDDGTMADLIYESDGSNQVIQKSLRVVLLAGEQHLPLRRSATSLLSPRNRSGRRVYANVGSNSSSQ